MGEMISIGHGSTQTQGYLARPRQGQGPGVLVFHAWWGLNAFIRGLADRIGDEGFVVLVPDYYQGEVASSIDRAKALRSQMDRASTYTIAKQALSDLLADGCVFPKEVATLGISLGCGPALELARSRADSVRAVVLFYGTGGGKFDSAKADFLGHFAEDDQWGAHAKKVAALGERLSSSSGKVEFHTYPGAQHWFFESDRADAYNETAAEEAWARTLRFLKQHFV
jgi:carboxymethylenebutenolidase